MTVAEHLQVGHFMLDNASNNNTAMQKFAGLLKSHGITSDFDANDHQIMCLLHIFNIYSKHVVEKYTSTNFLCFPVEHGLTCLELQSTKVPTLMQLRKTPLSMVAILFMQYVHQAFTAKPIKPLSFMAIL